MAEKGTKIEGIGEIVEEKPTYTGPEYNWFKLITRTIQFSDGHQEDQVVQDSRGKRFAVGVAMTAQGMFPLVTEPKRGRFELSTGFATGAMKKGETPEEAATRELEEETGYTATNWRPLFPNTVYIKPDKEDGGDHEVLLATDAQQVSDPEQYSTTVLVSFEDLERISRNEHEKIQIRNMMQYGALCRTLNYIRENNLLNQLTQENLPVTS